MTAQPPSPRSLRILRHADATDAVGGAPDFDRPLAPSGHEQARRLASHLYGVAIDYVLCSSATRTRQTIQPLLATRDVAHMPTVDYDKGIYRACGELLLDAVRGVRAEARSLLVVGHNPAVTDLVRLLAAGGQFDGLDRADLVTFEIVSDWIALEPVDCRLIAHRRGAD